MIKNPFKKKNKKLNCQWCKQEIFEGEDIICWKTGKMFDDGAVECIVVHKHCEQYLPELIKVYEGDE